MTETGGRGGAQRTVCFPMPRKLVVIGDLNGDDDALAMMLRALGLTSRDGSWTAEGVHLVQLGDVVNRGAQCRRALERLMRLEVEAEALGSRVTTLLGNHEAMVTLGNLAWCSPEELLEHAPADARVRYEMRRAQAVYELLVHATDRDRTAPIVGAVRAWEEANVPGRDAYREAMGPRGALGRFVRRLPVAIRVGPVLLVHGGLSLPFAELGLEGIEREAQATWARVPASEADLSPDDLLLAEDGPLWHRAYALGDEAAMEPELRGALRSSGASTMIVGHTRTDQVPGGRRGHPVARFGGRLICADVGIGSSGGAPAAVFIEKNIIWCWRPEERKRRLCTLPHPLDGEVTSPGTLLQRNRA